jgi:hypothetical protein
VVVPGGLLFDYDIDIVTHGGMFNTPAGTVSNGLYYWR